MYSYSYIASYVARVSMANIICTVVYFIQADILALARARCMSEFIYSGGSLYSIF